jgi:hypothetical protein
MRTYLSALWGHWVALMSGLVGLLLAVGLRIGRQVSADIRLWSDIPDWLFICVGAACLFWAGYATWNDTHRALVSLQERLRSPEFTGEVNFLSVCPAGSRDQDTFVIVMGSIVNHFGPPSAVLSWSMKLAFTDTRIIQGAVPLWNGKDIHLETAAPSKRAVTLNADGYWPRTASENPIPAGGIKSGWFWSDFKDITRDMILESTPSLVIEFTDAIAKNTHRIVVSPTSGYGQPLFGLDDVHNR